MTSNIQLIVTGEMERKALSTAFKKAFPEITFLPSQYRDGFTSADVLNIPYNVKPRWPSKLPIDKLANTLVAAVLPGKHREKPITMEKVLSFEIFKISTQPTKFWHTKFSLTKRSREFAKIEAKEFMIFTQIKLFTLMFREIV